MQNLLNKLWLVLGAVLLLPGILVAQEGPVPDKGTSSFNVLDVSGDMTGLTSRVLALESKSAYHDARLNSLNQKIDETIDQIKALQSSKTASQSKSAQSAPPTVKASSGGSSGGSTGIPKSGGSSGGSSYTISSSNRAHWTYPGTIENHLASGHGVSTSGMTREQMLNLHDSLHEGAVKQNNMYTTTYSYPSQSTSWTYSNCPNGRCPTRVRR